MADATNKKSLYRTPHLHSKTRDEVVHMVVRRLTLMNRVLPEFRDVWAVFYQRIEDGAEPMEMLHVINRYALGVCLRAALDLNMDNEVDDAERPM